jgi:ABC-2 type transport system permease protein
MMSRPDARSDETVAQAGLLPGPSWRETWFRSGALFRHNVRLLLADPSPIVLTTVMPVAMMAFLRGTGAAVLRQQGYSGASGAEVVVPGMAVLFAFFGVSYIAMGFFSEHHWGTWDRLRASAARPIEVVLGKILPGALLEAIQLVVLFVAGAVLFGFRIRGSVGGVAIMIAVSILFLVAMSMLFTALFTTVNQLSAVVNLAAMVLGGLGGALAPIETLPSWARAIAPVSPAYWMLDGFRNVVLEPGGWTSTLGPAAVTLAFAVGTGVIAATRFRLTHEKRWDE